MAADLHELTSAELLLVLQASDRQAVAAAHAVAPQVAEVVNAVVAAWPEGGRLIYVGAGTSGRIGALDAAECRPTFGVARDRVRAVIAGGDGALADAVEDAEDSETSAQAAMEAINVGRPDVVVALSASGTTPFTCAALVAAAARGATGVAVTCAADSRLAREAQIAVIINTGEEIIDGSTRMKAGTAQKLVCNAISTASFVRLGRVWGDQMVAVKATNSKLRRRATAILLRLGGCGDQAAAEAALDAAGNDLPTALVMVLGETDRGAAAGCLDAAHGNVHRALALARRAGVP